MLKHLEKIFQPKKSKIAKKKLLTKNIIKKPNKNQKNTLNQPIKPKTIIS